MKRGSSVLQPPSDAAKRHTHPADAHTHTHAHAHTKTHTGSVGAAAAAAAATNAHERTPDTHNVQGSSPFPAATSLFSPDVSTKMASDLLIRLSEATQKAQVHPGSRVEEELQLQQQQPPPPPRPPLSSQRREALLEARGGQQDEPGLALSPDGPGASPEPPSLTHTPDGNATAAAATDTLASDLLRKLAERQEVNCHGVRVKEEEEPMEIDTVAASDLIHDHRPITKELTTPSPSRPHFTIKAEEDDDDQGFSGNNQTAPEQLHPHGAKMAEQCLLGLKIEDTFFTGGGCQSSSKTAGDGVGVSGGNKFEFRFKMEDNGISGAKMADQLLSAGAKMDEQFLFKAKLAERPFSGAKVGRRFLSGVKTEEPFPPAVKLENGLAPGDQLFSRAKTEEQLFFGGANMEDQCLRAVLWQDMSVNLASTLLHQLSERVSKSNSQLLERSTPPMRSSPILKVNMDPLRSSPFLSSQETTQETESVLRSDRAAGCSYFYRCHVCGFETDGRRGLFHGHMAEHRQWEHGSFSLHCCVCDHSTNQEAEMRAHAATHIQGDTGVGGGDGRCPVTAAAAAAASGSSSSSSPAVAMPTQPAAAEEKSAGAASEHRCRICQRSFPGQQELLVHFQGHRQGNQYRCDRCGHLTRTANKLVEHVRVHTGERPFTCHLCPYSAKRRDSLRLHCKVKHAAAASAVATAAAHVNGNPADGGAPGDVHTHRSYVHGDNQRSNNKHVQRLHTPSYTHATAAAAARCSLPPLHPSLSALSPLLPITTLISLKPRPLPPPPSSSSSSSSPPPSSSSKHSFLSYLGLTTPL